MTRIFSTFSLYSHSIFNSWNIYSVIEPYIVIFIYGLVPDLSIPYLKNYRLKSAISGSTRISITQRIRPFFFFFCFPGHLEAFQLRWELEGRKEGRIPFQNPTLDLYQNNISIKRTSKFLFHQTWSFFFLDVCFLSLDRNVNLVATLLSTSQIYHCIQTLSYLVTLTRKLPNTPSSCLVLTFWLSRLKNLERNILIFCVLFKVFFLCANLIMSILTLMNKQWSHFHSF